MTNDRPVSFYHWLFVSYGVIYVRHYKLLRLPELITKLWSRAGRPSTMCPSFHCPTIPVLMSAYRYTQPSPSAYIEIFHQINLYKVSLKNQPCDVIKMRDKRRSGKENLLKKLVAG